MNNLISILNLKDIKVGTYIALRKHHQSTLILKTKKKISPKKRHECYQEITVAEYEKAIQSFENNKPLCNDGLPAEFYKTFTEILKTDLYKL